ncbi:MAG: hypothetical protein JO138_18790 [Acidobacteriaceae bacterium]|nr:hypothetical protein [Acidobacteriaceae bacterium]
MSAQRPEEGMLFRVFLNPDDLRQLVCRAMEQDETAAIVRGAVIISRDPL